MRKLSNQPGHVMAILPPSLVLGNTERRSGIRDYFPETRNNGTCVRKVLSAAGSLGLPILDSGELWHASEDFGYYTRVFPGAMFYVGNGTEYPPLHTVGYEFPDRILKTITGMFLALI